MTTLGTFLVGCALVLLVIVACQPCPPTRKVSVWADPMRTVEPCLILPPPAKPELLGDIEIDRTRKLDHYEALARWVEGYAWPQCSEQR